MIDWKNIKGAIFDLDGTLIDSLWIWAEIDRKFLTKRGITEVPLDYMHDIGLMTFGDAAVYTIKRFGLDEKPEDVMAEWSSMAVQSYATEIKIKPRVLDCLNALKAKGIRLAVATSATPDMCYPALQNNGIAHMFDAVVTTHEIGKGKSDPDVYLAAAERIGVTPAECAVYEDTLHALRTAKNAGFVTIGVYDKYSTVDENAFRALADDFITL